MNIEQKGKELSEKREGHQVQMRKQKREDMIRKKRGEYMERENEWGSGMSVQKEAMLELAREGEERKVVEELLENRESDVDVQQLARLYSEALKQEHMWGWAQEVGVLIQLRRATSQDDNQWVIQHILDNGLLGRLQVLLAVPHDDYFKMEASWILSNLSSGTNSQCRQLIQQGLMGQLVEQVKNGTSLLIREHCLWTIGNLVADHCDYRDELVRLQGPRVILQSLRTASANQQHPLQAQMFTKVLNETLWVFSIMLQSQPPLDQTQLKYEMECFLSMLVDMITNYVRLETKGSLLDALKCLVELSKGEDARQQKLMDSGVCVYLVEMLHHFQDKEYSGMQLLIMRVFSNLLSGTSLHCDYALEIKAVDSLFPFLHSTSPTLSPHRQVVLFSLVNLAHEGPHKIHYILQHVHQGEPFARAVFNIIRENHSAMLADLLSFLKLVISKADPQQVFQLFISRQILCELVYFMPQFSPPNLVEALNVLQLALEFGQNNQQNNCNTFVNLLEQENYLENLEELQEHQEDEVYRITFSIIKQYFNYEKEKDEEF